MEHDARFSRNPLRNVVADDPRKSLSFDEALGIVYCALREFPEARTALEIALKTWLEVDKDDAA